MFKTTLSGEIRELPFCILGASFKIRILARNGIFEAESEQFDVKMKRDSDESKISLRICQWSNESISTLVKSANNQAILAKYKISYLSN